MGEESENEQRARGGGREGWGSQEGGRRMKQKIGELERAWIFFANFVKRDSPRESQEADRMSILL